MKRSMLVLTVCTGLALVCSGIQHGRATRFRAHALVLRPAGAALAGVEAEIAEVKTRISRKHQESAEALAQPDSLPRLAEELAHEVRLAGAELTRLSIERTGPALALSATGGRFAVAEFLSRIDALLESHDTYAGRFSLTGGHDDATTIDLSVVPLPNRAGPPVPVVAWPTVGVAAVASALEPTHVPEAPKADTPTSRTNSPAVGQSRTAESGGVLWIGTITSGGEERHVLRFEEERVVVVLREGDRPVLGWSILGREPGRLFMSKEGDPHEVRR